LQVDNSLDGIEPYAKGTTQA